MRQVLEAGQRAQVARERQPRHALEAQLAQARQARERRGVQRRRPDGERGQRHEVGQPRADGFDRARRTPT